MCRVAGLAEKAQEVTGGQNRSHGVVVGMAADGGSGGHIPIDEQLNVMVVVV